MLDIYRVNQILGAPETLWSFLGKALPIATLVLGIFLNRWISRWDKRKKDKKAVDDLLTEIELLNHPVERQAKHVADFVAKLSDHNQNVSSFTSLPTLNLDRLASLDRPGIIDHLERALGSRRSALSTANDLFTNCDSLTGKYKELHQSIDDYLNRTSALLEQLANAVNSLQMAHAGMMNDLEREGKDPFADPFLSQIIELTQGRSKVVESPFREDIELYAPLRKVVAAFRTDPRARRLAEMNSEIHQLIRALGRERSYCITRLQKNIEIMERLYAGLMRSREFVVSRCNIQSMDTVNQEAPVK